VTVHGAAGTAGATEQGADTTESTVRRGQLTLGAVVGAALSLVGFMVGMRGLGDNSFLTHLATGRLILDSGSVPSSDPYSFTATGEPWVVQSWLASVLYAGIEELAGPGGIRVLIGVVFGALVAVAWLLARSAPTLLPRVAIVILVISVGGNQWSERPLVFGLLLLAVSLLVVERDHSHWWLLPVGWLWANTHGSFPLGVVALAVLAVGTRLDGRPIRHELRCLAALVAGCVLGAVGPLGLQVLVFPFALVGQQDMLQDVTEWRAPTFTSFSQRAFLVQALVAVAALARRPSWRWGLLMAVFIPLALLGLRNVAVASILLVPATAAGVPPVGRLLSEQRLSGAVRRLAPVALVAMMLVIASARLGQTHYDLSLRYPMTAMRWLAAEEIDPMTVRTAAPDYTGNLLTLLHGPQQGVFFDDRFDMYPEEMFRDHESLLLGTPGWRAMLDRWEIDLVLAPHVEPSGQLLLTEPQWRALYMDDHWLVACRRDADLCPTIC
jgi:hypothetical protein